MNEKYFKQVRVTKLAELRDLIQMSEKKNAHVQEAAYRLRFVRIAGIDAFEDLYACCCLLKEANMLEQAHAIAEIILAGTFDCSDHSKVKAQVFLNHYPLQEKEPVKEVVIYDSREKRNYKLSCIVSLYKEERRVEDCLKRLVRQSLYQKGDLELIFIDSDSPENEKSIFERFTREHQHIFYCKTDKREKLSTAWNRGVRKSTGLFLTFNAPSNVFVDDGLERLLSAIENNKDVAMVQGDVGENMVEYPAPNIPLRSSDIKRASCRSRNRVMQLDPFFYINYLAFDCCVVRRSLYDAIGGFDEKYSAAMENKFHLTALRYGKLLQTGDLISAAFEDDGPRLTVHPRIEIEHFLILYESCTLESMITSARFAAGLEKDSRQEILEKLLDLSMEHYSAYLADSHRKYYNLDIAETIAHAVVLNDNSSAGVWNDYALIKTKNQINKARMFLHVAKRNSHPLGWRVQLNMMILFLVEQLLQWTFLLSNGKRLQTHVQVGWKNPFLRIFFNHLNLLHNRHRTFQPDILGDVVW